VATRAAISGRRRVRARVEGTVQGVGFRPFVHSLAGELELGGSVLNDARGVQLEVEGDPEAVECFLGRLVGEAPPLAVVERVSSSEIEPVGAAGFEILRSDAGGEQLVPVAADAATCADCLAELFDPTDRRYRYPFINCTNCGPRFTIVRGTPYDRPRTTMAGFEMCRACRAEYEDPADRRFHAQPNACPDCGPRARVLSDAGQPAPDRGDAVAATSAALLEGAIVAVKGLGGYHLACRADHQGAVAELRARKRREEKPFALMAPDLEAARQLAELGPEQEALLAGRERPIVLARRHAGAAVASAVAPGSRDLGLMLPYSPLHHLLLADAGTTLVMTSGNASDEPIAFHDDAALERLRGIADLFLVHDRPIETRTDDSVVQFAHLPERAREAQRAARALLLRRSRGYVPESIELPVECETPVLACGAELKNTFCVAKGRRAWVGHHIGDLRDAEALASFREGIEHLERLFAVSPGLCAHDLHPDYLSTRYALEHEGVELVGVQHHHAHLAACLAEHGLAGPAVGAIYDGTGYGTDGTVWGGEFLVGGLAGFERAGRLWSVRMPGGEAAIREPWRMACAWTAEALGEEPPIPALLQGRVGPRAWRASHGLARSGLASPTTSSVGRLFDAMAALCGIRATVSYEGQAAFELQAACDEHERGAYPLPAIDASEEPAAALGEAIRGPGGLAAGGRVLDARATVAAALSDLNAGVAVPQVAARFHNGLAQATADTCVDQAQRRDLELVVLSGGVFQNRLLLERTAEAISAAGLRVLVPVRLPPNDGGISYGQAAVAAARSQLRSATRA
jgi:hydrogenase maturation protein HypF